jgi:adenosylmethionine-8-amino-7-oxononanoate aminotransferase
VPDGDVVKRVLAEALDRDLIVLSAGSYGQVVRIIPPLVTTAEEIELALGILDESLAEAAASSRQGGSSAFGACRAAAAGRPSAISHPM